MFNEGSALDREATEEGMDITNHRDIFRVLYTKVRSLLNNQPVLQICVGSWYPKCFIISTHLTTSNVTGQRQ